jgi:hypothetical protein
MLDDSGKGNAERFGEARDRDGALAELFHNRSAGGVAEGVEDTVDIGFLFMHRLPVVQVLVLFPVTSSATREHHAWI